MPKTAVDKDYLAARWEYKIGFARQVAPMQTIAVPGTEGYPPNSPFGSRVFASDARHHPATLGWGQGIHTTCALILIWAGYSFGMANSLPLT